MKKFLGAILVLVCFITPAFAEPVSQEVLNQARTQAGLFMDLKNALGLEWLDEYNIYLTDPTGNPAPSWASSVDELINKNYLSVAFPTDFTISPAGKEVTISRTITNQGIKDALPIYLPSISISGDTVSLLVQRPAQWVAWEAGLNSKISRDGEGYSDGGLDVLAGTILEFGTRTGIEFASDSKIEFINGDGKLIGIDSLEYKDQELDDRFVNVTGDTMSGSLTAPEYRISDVNTRIYKGEANSVRIQTNFGRVDIGPQDVNYAHFSTDRSKFLFDEPVYVKDRIQIYGADTYLIATEGKIDGHKILTTADEGHGKGLDADTLDGDHASSFSRVGHGHNYVSREGDTMEGNLTMTGSTYITSPEYHISDSDTRINKGTGFGNFGEAVRLQTKYGFVDIGSANLEWAHFTTDRPGFYFGKPVHVKDKIQIYDANTYLAATEGKIAGNKIWHQGNDGSGSGLDADLLDGKDSSGFIWKPIYIGKGTNLNDIQEPGMYSCPSGEVGLTIINTPHGSGNSAFSLFVEKTAYVKQTYTDYYPAFPRTWIRTYYNFRNLWGPWFEVEMGIGDHIGTWSFSTPGTYIWEPPQNIGLKYILVWVWGGGASGEGYNNGGASSFGNYATAYGGQGIQGGSYSIYSPEGTNPLKGGDGESYGYGGRTTPESAGMGGDSTIHDDPNIYGGGAGAYVQLVLSMSLLDPSITITVGAGGAGNGSTSLPGKDGRVMIRGYN